MSDALVFVREVSEPEGPPPILSSGAAAWAKANLFSSIGSSLTTFVFVALALWLLPPLIDWATTKAVWAAPDGVLCRQHQDGACWAFIAAKIRLSALRLLSDRGAMARRRRGGDRRRIDRLAALAGRARAAARGALLFFVVYPVLAFVLLHGSARLGLPLVDTLLWGGVFVSLLTAVVGIVFSLPLGVLLALGRRSRMPVVRAASVLFIEFVRGVPFITILFMANTMLPLFVPEVMDAGPTAAAARRHRPVLRRLYGGGSPRRAAIARPRAI